MSELNNIAEDIQSVAAQWTQLAMAKGWAENAEEEHALLIKCMLEVTIAVLTSDGPLNLAESVLLAQLYGSDQAVQDAEYRSSLGDDLVGDSLPALAVVVESFAAQPGYRPDADPILTVLGDVFDATLAADNFPSEGEAWAASRVLGKLRRAALGQDRLLDFEKQNPVPTQLPSTAPEVPEPELVQAPPVSSSHSSQTSAVRALLLELENLVGLKSVKEEVETLINLARVRAIRTERGLPSPDISFHLVFSGNPGTGKTTVARILGQVYGALGMLAVGKCIEVDRSALIGGYLGQTTIKTAEVLQGAQGSVLFIDEAYSLTEGHGNSNSYGEEAISVLLKFMEDHRDTFVMIAAGYTDKMELFLDSNPGLRSRFAKTIQFPDYSLDELAEILGRMCAADGYRLDKAALPAVRQELGHLLATKPANFANGREARKIYERAIGRQANRIAGSAMSDDDLCVLVAEDFFIGAWPRAAS